MCTKIIIDDRVQTMEETETAYITIKDNKSESPNKVPCWLIISAESNFGKISKVILGKINKQFVVKNKMLKHISRQTFKTLNWNGKIHIYLT